MLLNPLSAMAEHARLRPGSLALVVDGAETTYGALALAAGRFARWLLADGPRPDRPHRVGVLASRSLETYTAIAGAGWAGATYVPINPKLPTSRVAAILGQAGVDALVVDALGSRHLSSLDGPSLPRRILGVDPQGGGRAEPPRALEGLQPLPSPARVTSDHVVYIMFTSGTTGVPKGVMITAGNLRHFLDRLRDLYGVGPADRVSNYSEVSFDFSVLDLFMTWDSGASLHVVPFHRTISPAALIQGQGLTFWASVPSVVALMDRTGQLRPGAFPTLKTTFFCGEALPLSSVQAWRRAAPNSVIDNHYGPTEATVACSFYRFEEPGNVTPGRGNLSIGLPYPGMYLDVVSADGQFLPAGTLGELAITGPQVAAGYLGDPALTDSRFTRLTHPDLGTHRWYLTGDSGYRDADGNLHHHGRLDNQIKVRGHRIELEEVDSHLRSVCGVSTVATVAWPLENGVPIGLVAVVVGCDLEPGQILDALRQRLPAYMLPRQVVRLESLPLSSNGKVDRKQIAERLAGAAA